MEKGSPPTPPNPILTGAAQTGTNVGTAIANSYLNNVNQITPNGNLSYAPTGSYTWTDPVSGASYNIPTFTATQTLPSWATDPGWTGFSLQGANDATQYNSANIATKLSFDLLNSARAGQLTVDPNSDPYGYADPNRLLAGVGSPLMSYGGYGPQQTSIGDTGNITTSYGPGDFSADRQSVQDALMARLQPSLDQDRQRLEQRLADQGIRYGSPAYDDAMRQLNQQQTDARFAAIGQAGQEQQRMMDMAAQRAGFENAAQQQRYQQALGSGQFYNQAQQQQYQQAALGAQFYNQGLSQLQAQNQAAMTAQDQARQTWLQEQYDQANQGINQITALLSGSQVAKPNYVSQPTSNIATTDYAALINSNFNQQLQNYQQQSQNFNSLMGGIFGMMGGLLKSDERTKDVGDKVGTIFAVNPDNEPKPLPVYEYNYKGDTTPHIGPMAQDVEKIDPRAVKTVGGVKHIDVTRMGSILRPVTLKKVA